MSNTGPPTRILECVPPSNSPGNVPSNAGPHSPSRPLPQARRPWLSVACTLRAPRASLCALACRSLCSLVCALFVSSLRTPLLYALPPRALFLALSEPSACFCFLRSVLHLCALSPFLPFPTLSTTPASLPLRAIPLHSLTHSRPLPSRSRPPTIRPFHPPAFPVHWHPLPPRAPSVRLLQLHVHVGCDIYAC